MPDTAIEISFADGVYRFWLGLPQVVELERVAGDKSLFQMHDEMGVGLGLTGEGPVYFGGCRAKATDVRETIRLGLIGGGSAMVDGEERTIKANRARELVDTYVFPKEDLVDSTYTAFQIIDAAVQGTRLKKKAAADQTESLSPSEKGS